MLDFILSKLNLLILVTAIFAIVSFFSFGLGDIAKVKEAEELSLRLNERAFALASSPSYCFSDSQALPGELSIAGGNFYYVLKISKKVIRSGGENVNTLIFSVYPREELKKSIENSEYKAKSIAASSFRTKAGLFLYAQDYDGTSYTGGVSRSDEIFLDPQALVPVDSLEMVKEVQGGESSLYVIACNSAICKANKTSVGNIVHKGTATEEGGFFC